MIATNPRSKRTRAESPPPSAAFNQQPTIAPALSPGKKMTSQDEARSLLQRMLGTDREFREGQWEAIHQVANQRRRVLVVQRTGWGKSIVYFLATKILRQAGAGPTLLISPLLSLMRNQIQSASRLGLRAVTIHSENVEEWKNTERALEQGGVDVLLVSPERLANPDFLQRLLPFIQEKIGLFAVDEAHCISDWGHDFRPDYRRIIRILQLLPAKVPVLCTTATANNRVVSDIESQISGLQVQRGPLVRPSLRLYTVKLDRPAKRLAWLADFLPELPGSGIVYTLTIQDAERVAAWLQSKGIAASAYHSDIPAEERVRAEEQLLGNKIKALVATVALGMGFDKPDLGFVVHYQRPGSVVAYYQQVGRAGRALDSAFGILLSGEEDDDIQEFFIRNAFPPIKVLTSIFNLLNAQAVTSLDEISNQLNVARGSLDKALRLLEVEGAISREKGGYLRKARDWKPDTVRFDQVTGHRLAELGQIKEYMSHPGCLMEFLTRALDDTSIERCGKCMNCAGQTKRRLPSPDRVREAEAFLGEDHLILEPRRQWPRNLLPLIHQQLPRAVERTAGGEYKAAIPWSLRASEGRILASGRELPGGKATGQGGHSFESELVEAAARMILEKWKPSPPIKWVTVVPSARRPKAGVDFAARLAARLNLPFHPVLRKTRNTAPQQEFQNSVQQLRNILGSFEVEGKIKPEPVLLLDDVVGSRWTMTLAAALLRQAGSGAVYPFALEKRLGPGEG